MTRWKGPILFICFKEILLCTLVLPQGTLLLSMLNNLLLHKQALALADHVHVLFGNVLAIRLFA